MSNEVKIGLLAIVTIALSFWGYKFILGKNVLTKSNNYKVLYENVGGLQIGTTVRINGVAVGTVASITLLPDEKEQVLVLLDLQKSIAIPKSTVAAITSVGFMGGQVIVLEYDKPCKGNDCAESGSFIKGETRGLLASMMGVDDLKIYMDILKTGLIEVLDSLDQRLLDPDSNSPLAKSVKDLQGTLANLNTATGRVDDLLRTSSKNINGSLANLNTFTGGLADKQDEIAGIIDNAKTLSQDLADAKLKETMLEAQAAIVELKTAIKTADGALSGVSDVVGKIKNGEGSLGKLLQDEELYNNLNSLSRRADSLITDIQDRPYRYMPLKGRKKVQRYDRLDEKN
ncbi:MAG: mammalian cell entry protein [Saprospiraceae bacterium]|nr:MAG: mammalian cell entry protein [Saprospiraceae bacterium]